jgi:hypothetical protein
MTIQRQQHHQTTKTAKHNCHIATQHTPQQNNNNNKNSHVATAHRSQTSQ